MLPKFICAVILILSACAAVLFTQCYFVVKDSENVESYDPGKADEIAVQYANEKYGEEFVKVDHCQRTDSIIGGNHWVIVRVVKKGTEKQNNPRQYEICITGTNEYKILGDNIITEYYQELYKAYVTPIIEEQLGDIPFVVIVSDNPRNYDYNTQYGVIPEAEIPISFEDEKALFKRKDFSLQVAVPEAYDTEENDLAGKANQLSRALAENYYGISSDIRIEKNDEFKEIVFADDPFWEFYRGSEEHFLSHKSYEIKVVG